MLQACETARFTDVVGQLPHGLETNIQEKGVNLSGGQKQRLALARAFWPPEAATLFSSMSPPAASIQKPMVQFLEIIEQYAR